jgi:glutamate-ammonia-ligase adenylyltransferase
MRLRPMGKSSSLAIPLCEFRRYYDSEMAQLWERQSLVRCRVVYGDPEFGTEVMAAVHHAVCGALWRPEFVDQIRTMREKLESAASSRSLKRGPGGLVDIEFIVQMSQIKYGRDKPSIVRTNVWESLDALLAVGLIDAYKHRVLSEAYSFLRSAEARLRIVTNRPLNEYPDSPDDLEKFARRMGFAPESEGAAPSFRKELNRHTVATRRIFDVLMSEDELAQ